MSRIEREVGTPDTDTLQALATTFRVAFPDLAGWLADELRLTEAPGRVGMAQDDMDRLVQYVADLYVFDPVTLIGLWSRLPRGRQDAVADFIRWEASRDQEDQSRATG